MTIIALHYGNDDYFKVQSDVLGGVRAGSQDRKTAPHHPQGVPVADVIPPGPSERPSNWLGAMAESARIQGDILEPSDTLVDWEAETE